MLKQPERHSKAADSEFVKERRSTWAKEVVMEAATVKDVVAFLHDQEPDIRMAAANRLVKDFLPEASEFIGELASRLEDGNMVVQLGVAEALKALGLTATCYDVLIRLDHKETTVRRAAQDALLGTVEHKGKEHKKQVLKALTKEWEQTKSNEALHMLLNSADGQAARAQFTVVLQAIVLGHDPKPASARLEELLEASSAMTAIENKQAIEQLRQAQYIIFRSIVDPHRQDKSDIHSQKSVEAFRELKNVAEKEHCRLTDTVLPAVMGKYKQSPSWSLLETVKSTDPLLMQPCPNKTMADSDYFTYLSTMAELSREEFEMFLSGVAQAFNSAPSTMTANEWRSSYGLPEKPAFADKPLWSSSTSFRFKERDQLVKLCFGPPKSRDRAIAKGKTPWVQNLSEPGPRMRFAVTDIMRATLEFADPLVLALCVELVLHLKRGAVPRVVNRMLDEKISQPPNINSNIFFGEILVEVQFLLTDVLRIKKTLHKLYEAKRADGITALPVFLFNWQNDPCSLQKLSSPQSNHARNECGNTCRPSADDAAEQELLESIRKMKQMQLLLEKPPRRSKACIIM